MQAPGGNMEAVEVQGSWKMSDSFCISCIGTENLEGGGWRLRRLPWGGGAEELAQRLQLQRVQRGGGRLW